MRLAIFSAFPHELRETLRNLSVTKTIQKPFKTYFVKHSSYEIALVQTRMGTCNAEAVLDYVLSEYTPDFIVSMGFGGALYDGAGAGDLIWPSKVVYVDDKVEDTLELPDSGEIAGRLSRKVIMNEGTVVTIQGWMKKSEIKKVAPGLSFAVCDMETFPLARGSIQRGIPFFAFRSITDMADEDIPQELLNVSDELGEYKLSRSLKLLLSRPTLIPNAARLGKTSRKASHRLWHALQALVETL
jgi:adenosylhomocysteine nucleosidase